MSPVPFAPEIVHVALMDLVGFSRMSMEQESESERDLRADVEACETYRRAVEAGDLISFDTGDGIGLVFAGDPRQPPSVALEILRRRHEFGRPSIRLGLHSGPAVRCVDIAGKPNAKGVAINVAQRVMDAAPPGRIYLTEHYAETLRGFEEWEGRIVGRGTHVVKHGLRLRLCELGERSMPRARSSEEDSGNIWKVAAVLLLGPIAMSTGVFWSTGGEGFMVPQSPVGPMDPLDTPRDLVDIPPHPKVEPLRRTANRRPT